MRIFQSKEEALKSLERYLTIDIKKHENHIKKYDFFSSDYNKREIGKFFLYESLSRDRLGYPKLGVYLNELPCDQTTEVEWVDYRRSIEVNVKFKSFFKRLNGVEFESINRLCDVSTEINRLILWNDTLLVYGSWDSIPSWVDLRQAYERTLWFHRTDDEKRDIQLNRILKV